MPDPRVQGRDEKIVAELKILKRRERLKDTWWK